MKLKVLLFTLLIISIYTNYVSATLEEFTINVYDDSAQPTNDNFELAIFSYVYVKGQDDIAYNQYLDFFNWVHNTLANNSSATYSFTVVKKIMFLDNYFHTTDFKLSYLDISDTSQSYIFDTYFLIKLLNANDNADITNISNTSTISVYKNNAYYLVLKHKKYDPAVFSSTTEDVMYPLQNIIKVDFSSAEDVTDLFDSTNTNVLYMQIDLDSENKIQTYYLVRYSSSSISYDYYYKIKYGHYLVWYNHPIVVASDNTQTSRLIGSTSTTVYPLVWINTQTNVILTIDSEVQEQLQSYKEISIREQNTYVITTTPIKVNNKIYYAVAYKKAVDENGDGTTDYYVLTITKYVFDAITKNTLEYSSYDIKVSDKIINSLPKLAIYLAGVVRTQHNDVVFYDWWDGIFIYFNFNNKLGIILNDVKQNDFSQFKHSNTLYTTQDDTLNIMWGIDDIKDDMFIIVQSYDSLSNTYKFTKYNVKLADWFENAEVLSATRIVSTKHIDIDENINIELLTEDSVTKTKSSDLSENTVFNYILIDLNQDDWFNLVKKVNWPKTAYDITVYDKDGADVTNSVNIRVESLDCEITKDNSTLNRFWISEDDYSKTCNVVIDIENEQGAVIYQKSTQWTANGQLNSEIIDMSSSTSSNSSSDEGSTENSFGDGYYFVIYDDTLQQVCDEHSYVFKTEDGQVLNFKVTDDCRIYIDWSQIDQDGDGLPDFDKILIYKDGQLVREIDTTTLKKNEDTIIFAYNSDEKFVLLINLYFTVDQTLSQLDYNDIRDDLMNNLAISIKLEGNMVLQGVKQDNAIINLLKTTDEYSCKVIFDRTSATYTTRFVTYACLIDRKVLLDGQTYNVYVSAQTKIAKVLFGVIDLGVQMQQFTYTESMQYKRLDTYNFQITLTEDLQSQIEKKRMFRDFFLNTQFWAMLIIIAIVVIVKYLTLSDKIAVGSGALIFLVLVALHIISSAYLILISLIAIVIASLKLSDKLTAGGSD